MRPSAITGLALAALVLALSGCSASSPNAATTTTTSTSTTSPAPSTRVQPTTTAAPTTTTTTVYAPTKPASTPDAAAAELIGDWASGSQAAAATIAAPSAVSALFAAPYPAGAVQARGCTDPSVNPGTCTYRNTQTEGLYELGVSTVAGGWYVSAVTVEE